MLLLYFEMEDEKGECVDFVVSELFGRRKCLVDI